MALVSFEDVSLEFGDQPLLVRTQFGIEPGERVCLIGRNGAGKTSMLRLISGKYQPDGGEIRCQTAIRIGQLEQTLPEELDETVHDFAPGLFRVVYVHARLALGLDPAGVFLAHGP